MVFGNLAFKHKICLLIALPLLGFLWMSYATIHKNVAISNEMTELVKLTKLSTVYSDLVHELQKERGITAGYLGSKGQKFAQQLSQQRRQSNEKLESRNDYWRENPFSKNDIISLNHSITQELDDIGSIRRRVDNQSITLAQALSYYTLLNKKLLSVSEMISRISTNAQMSKEVIAYYNFLQGKERAGIERAVLSNTFANQKFADDMLVQMPWL